MGMQGVRMQGDEMLDARTLCEESKMQMNAAGSRLDLANCQERDYRLPMMMD